MTPRRRRAAFALAVLLLAAVASTPLATPAAPVKAASDKPNIVVIMLDDTAVHDGRLWGASDELGHDPSLTPTLYNLFVQNGVYFPNAISDTPLCCPARATFLTGLHTHNHGVTQNDVALFNPTESLATELTGAGYETMLVGKYMNHPENLTPPLWAAHSAGWSVFDIFTSTYDALTGFFVDYEMTTKDGQVLAPTEHSTQLIAERTVAHMAATDPEKPIFAMLSVVDTHLPNIPMPQFATDTRCDTMPPWQPPNYNEADVSDKPAHIQSIAPFMYPDPRVDGWPMTTMCREMLGVDWTVDLVVDELAAEGRLDNTLFVFTADNGMAWGSHRWQLKEVPYVTPVPLYFSWPARWSARTEPEFTSSIDLAPTLCEIGGCSLGPFPGGQTEPDGVSLRPLLDGEVENLGRDALLETSWRVRPWAAVRTTELSELGLWHYVEYNSGFRELYNVDPEEDPWELDNLAYDPAYADIRAALSDRLLDLLAEGRPDSTAWLTIIQDSLPNHSQDFAFSGDLGSFTLDDDGNPTLPRKRLFTNLVPGAYEITQADVPNWDLFAISCPAGSRVDLPAGRVTVQLLPGDQVTCTFKNAGRRPDASIALAPAGLFKGDGVYSTAPNKKQTQRYDLVAAGQVYGFRVALQNDGKHVDSFTVRGTATGSAAMPVSYLVGDVDVTPAVVAGTYTITDLAPNASVEMTVQVTVAADAPIGIKTKIVVSQTSTADATRLDVVRGVVTR